MGSLASVLDELLAADPHDVPGQVLLGQITADRRQANRLDGVYMVRLVIADRTGAATADHGSTQAWLQAATMVNPSRAHRDVRLARDLADHMPKTLAALCAGELSLDHAQVISRLHGQVSDEHFAAAEPHLVAAARWKNPRELNKVVAHVLHSHRPDKAARNE